MHGIESRFVIGSSITLFAGVYVCTFQPGNFTGYGGGGGGGGGAVKGLNTTDCAE